MPQTAEELAFWEAEIAAHAEFESAETERKKQPKEITAERFDDMLNVLPPCKWCKISGVETFHVSERITGNIVSWFISIRRDGITRCFEVDADAALCHWDVLAIVEGVEKHS